MFEHVFRDIRATLRSRPLFVLACAGFMAVAPACAKVSQTGTPSTGNDASVHADAPASVDRITSTPDVPITPGSDAPIGGSTDTGGGDGGGGSCMISCTPANGRYCGDIGNGCLTGTLSCGACPGDQVCEASVCVGGSACKPFTCSPEGGGQYCGAVGDGCGRKLTCPDCPSGQICSDGVCIPGAGCVPLTCNPVGGGKYCGTIGDGCGKKLDCGDCTAPQVCGGVTPSVCGPAPGSCTPLTCVPSAGGQYCGKIGNGCGGTLECGACMNGMACGTGATANVCPSMGTCTNLQCQIERCEGGAPTSISGTVYDPAGKNPLYNVVLYVPNTALDPITTGATCDRCASPVSGQPVAAALSDAKGQFKMNNVPSGTNIPLVIQVGKWRRQITLPMVKPCQDNTFADPTGDKLFRLPRQKSEGNMPLIAMSTGHSDVLDCLLRKIGIVDAEFTNDTGGGRVHMYVGGDSTKDDTRGADRLASGAMFADSYKTLFPNYTKLSGYDLLLLQCEGSQLADLKAPHNSIMKKYADNGGRIFAEHLHSAWFQKGSAPWPSTASWVGVKHDLADPSVGTVVTTFPKGMALADWLVTVGASTTRGQIPLVMAQNSVNLPVATGTQAWITAPAYEPAGATSVQYLTFNTPVEAAADAQCGRAVFTDVHVGAGGGTSNPDKPFPTGCAASLDMSAQEKALEFMFFDLSSCVQTTPGNPMVPLVPPPGVPPMVPPGITPPPPPIPPPPPPPPPPPIP